MSVTAGFGEEKFDPVVIEKIETLYKIKKEDELEFRICVDGGINLGNIISVMEKGCDEVAIGGGLFKNDIKENIDKYEDKLKI